MACIAMFCIDFKMNLKSLGFWLCGFKSRSGTMQSSSAPNAEQQINHRKVVFLYIKISKLRTFHLKPQN